MAAYHLGIYAGHDTGVAVVDENLHIVHLFEEERFNGEKMTYFNPYFALKEMIRRHLKHFRTITFGFNPDEAQADFLKKFVRFQKVRSEEILKYLSGKVTWDKVCFAGHHDCHAAGAFFPSGFDSALIMVADGTGESESTSFYEGREGNISRISSERTNDFSLGILYQYFTEWLGYRTHNTSQHCGKIMGLASYGRPVYRDRIVEMLRHEGAGYRWPGGSLLETRGKIAEIFGVPRPRPVKHFSSEQADVACSIQTVLEEIILEKLEAVKERHPISKSLLFRWCRHEQSPQLPYPEIRNLRGSFCATPLLGQGDSAGRRAGFCRKVLSRPFSHLNTENPKCLYRVWRDFSAGGTGPIDQGI